MFMPNRTSSFDVFCPPVDFERMGRGDVEHAAGLFVAGSGEPSEVESEF